MNEFFTKIFYSFLFLFLWQGLIAQTKFIATATPIKAGIDEYITLTLTVANGNNVQNINPPAIADFKVVSGPSTTTEENTINGVTSQYISISYILLAKKIGNFKIKPSTAVINGLTFKSNSIIINVSKNKSANSVANNLMAGNASSLSGFDPFNEPETEVTFSDYILRKGENIKEKVSNNMQLKLQTSKTSCYVGEALLATYKLYTRLKSESSLSKNPSFSGFSVVEMMQPNESAGFSTEKLNGKPYNVYTIRKAQLYPLQPGPIEIESAALDNRVSFIKYNGNNGNNYNIDPDALITQTVVLSCKPMTINVKPLPEFGKPESFKGTVGNFTIDAALQKEKFTTDETGKLYITISGRGNMQLLTVPDIIWPKEFEIFDAKTTDNTDNKTIPISGSKTFEISFAVGKSGSYKTPQINFSFFDPELQAYKIVTAPSISFNVAKGVKNIFTSITDTTHKTNTNISLLHNIVNYGWLILLFSIGIIITLITFWFSKETKVKNVIKENKITLPTANIDLQKNPLTKTEDCLFKNECVTFYNIINEEMKTYLANRFKLSVENINVKTLGIEMDKQAIANETILNTQRLVQDIERQLYMPYERDEALNEIYIRAQNIVQLLAIKHKN